MVRTKIIHEGQTYYTVGAAAKMLRTNIVTVKQLMGNSSLEWLNFRVNGQLVIPESSLLTYQRISMIQKRVAHQFRKS